MGEGNKLYARAGEARRLAAEALASISFENNVHDLTLARAGSRGKAARQTAASTKEVVEAKTRLTK